MNDQKEFSFFKKSKITVENIHKSNSKSKYIHKSTNACSKTAKMQAKFPSLHGNSRTV